LKPFAAAPRLPITSHEAADDQHVVPPQRASASGKDIFFLSFHDAIDVATTQREHKIRFDSSATALSASRNLNATSKISVRKH
jgi:hypothetical protein